MKLVRYGKAGKEKPGVIDAKGKLRDCSDIVSDWAGEELAHKHIKKVAKALKSGDLKSVSGSPRIGACVARPCNFVAIGLNYADHAAESGMPIPAEPIIFTKAPNCIVGPNDDVMIPRDSKKTDWEVELGFVIGKRASYVSEDDALDHVAGYCLANDVSEREFQLERGGSWIKGKSAPTFGPLGPWLVTPDEVGDPQDLGMWLDVNGARMQTGSTKTMIFNVRQIVSYVSRFLTLEVGDVVVTGTPPGVGSGKKPPVFLKAGDTMSLGIDKLGEQACRVVGYEG
ncbi:MAG: fumarylacetoacetate hydrolase family protein [Rhodoblastus sp.]